MRKRPPDQGTTETVTVESFGPWEVTVRTVTEVRRVRRRPRRRDPQPLFEQCVGKPVPLWAPRMTNPDKVMFVSATRAALQYDIPEWQLWKNWFAVHGAPTDPAAFATPPLPPQPPVVIVFRLDREDGRPLPALPRAPDGRRFFSAEQVAARFPKYTVDRLEDL